MSYIINSIPTEPYALLRAAAPTQNPILTVDEINGITTHINMYRKKHGAPPLTFDATISTFSQNWANYLLLNNKFVHSGNSSYGECLAYFRNYNKSMIEMIKLSIDMWYAEIINYDFNNPVFNSATGHATQILWVASKTYGVGYSYDEHTDTVIVSMNFSPPGNVSGKFKQNVLPAIDTIIINNPPTIPIIVRPTTDLPIPITPSNILTDKCNNTENILELYNILKDISYRKSQVIIVKRIKDLIKTMTNQS